MFIRRFQKRLARLAFVLMATASLACTASPVPEPPNLDPPDELKMRFEDVGNGRYALVGEPGAAEPETLWLADLDRTEPASTERVDPDGSFRIEFTAERGDEARVQVRRGTARSEPLDVDVIEGPVLVSIQSLECLRSSLPLELDFGRREPGEPIDDALVLENECPDPVTVMEARMRRGTEGFTVESAPGTIAPGDEGVIDVEFRPPASGTTEDILLIRVDGGFESERFAVTLFGEGR